jgi:ribonuclease J
VQDRAGAGPDRDREGVDDTYQLQQNIRRVIGRWVSNRHRRRPMIIPVVVEA